MNGTKIHEKNNFPKREKARKRHKHRAKADREQTRTKIYFKKTE